MYTIFDETYMLQVHIYAQIIITSSKEITTGIQKGKNPNNKSRQCNTRFDDTYSLQAQYMHRLSSHHQKRSQQAYKKGKTQIIKVGNVILDLMTLTSYTSTIQVEIIITLGIKIKRDIKKRKLSNKSSESNTRIKYTYNLYKYNIGIDYHHIKNRDKERDTKT